MFNRAKQFTEERLGKAERTENDAAFESLSKRTDKIKGYTEKLVKNSEFLQFSSQDQTITSQTNIHYIVYFSWIFLKDKIRPHGLRVSTAVFGF